MRPWRPLSKRRRAERKSRMYEILEKEYLNPTVAKMVVAAPLVARKAEPGQFIILRAKEESERLP